MRHRRLRVGPLCWLTAVWVLLWGNVSWANVLAGLVLSAVVLLAFPLPRIIFGVAVRPWPLVRLVVRFLSDLVAGSVLVAWQAVRPGPVVNGSVLEVRLRGREPLFQTIIAEMVALVPGTVVIDLDGDTGQLILHALDTHTDEQVRAVRRSVLSLEARVYRALAPASERAVLADTHPDPATTRSDVSKGEDP